MCKIQFRCCYVDKGCSEILPYEKLFAHQDQCPTIIFNCGQCSFVGVIGSPEHKMHNCVEYLTNELTLCK